jgi:LmbE family N-acetylglucosaminyl deacetylase
MTNIIKLKLFKILFIFIFIYFLIKLYIYKRKESSVPPCNQSKLKFKEAEIIRIEVKTTKQLKLFTEDYPKLFIKYKSNHPEIIKIDNDGKITALRPGSSIISAEGFFGQKAHIKALAISKNGLIDILNIDKYNVRKYKKIMIVAHPDDETLWGGANLYKSGFFVVCLTNGYNLPRANDYRNLLKFTKNDGIILDYPDIQDKIIDDWSEVKIGILKDLSKILNYKDWEAIVTHGPDGTTGHIHHKKTCQFVTQVAKESNKYKYLYYFGKYYQKNKIPQNLTRITKEEYNIKKKEIAIYKSVISIIHKLWYHMLPYENWILASQWKE